MNELFVEDGVGWEANDAVQAERAEASTASTVWSDRGSLDRCFPCPMHCLARCSFEHSAEAIRQSGRLRWTVKHGPHATGRGALSGYPRWFMEHIIYEVDNGIATITIDRPEKKNAMTYMMLGEFIETVAHAASDTSARVVVLTGRPGAFCAGTDLADLATIPGSARGLRGSAQEHDKWWPLLQCPQPTICAIDGPAVGMGAEFTSQCDIRIATPNARFAWNFVHRGLVPDTGAGTWLLPRLIGLQNALRLLYTGEFVSAQDALQLGYVQQVVSSESLLDTAYALAATIASGSPHSQRLIKSLVYEGLPSSVEQHMLRHTAAMSACFKSDDHREGVASFLERRSASFTGQ